MPTQFPVGKGRKGKYKLDKKTPLNSWTLCSMTFLTSSA